MRRLLVVVAFLGACMAASAGTICPASSGTGSFTHPPDAAATGCNVVLTVAANGTVSVAVRDSTPYENSEDVLVGIQNNSANTVSSISLTGSGIFGFDGDGICTFVFVGNGYCSGAAYQQDPGDYAGPTSSFSGITNGGNQGTVNFSPAVPANGGTSYFSLEGVPTQSLVATVTGTGGGTPPTGGGGAIASPTLSEWGMILLGLLLMASASLLLRKTEGRRIS